jgi:hypothetical protein
VSRYPVEVEPQAPGSTNSESAWAPSSDDDGGAEGALSDVLSRVRDATEAEHPVLGTSRPVKRRRQRSSRPSNITKVGGEVWARS